MSLLLNRTLRLFLDSIGRREEYEYYLRRFQAQSRAAFAILCPIASGFEEVAPFFMFDLDFLRRLELFPVILCCAENIALRPLLERAASDPVFLDIEPLLREEEGTPAKILEVLAQSRKQGRPAVLLVPGMSWEEVLPRLIPNVAQRVHFIRVRGALHDAKGDPLSYYYLRRPPEEGLAEEDVCIAQVAAHLLETRPGTHISVASPWKLLEELFTVRGSGSVVRLGAEIHRYDLLEGIDRTRLIQLLQESFGRPLADPDVLDLMSTIYIGGDYMGAALIESHSAGAYLSKFAVGTQARGEGLAHELWAVVTSDFPRLFWRARANNPINHWYEKQADGYHLEGAWKVFWRGTSADDLTGLVRFALDRPADFLSEPPVDAPEGG